MRKIKISKSFGTLNVRIEKVIGNLMLTGQFAEKLRGSLFLVIIIFYLILKTGLDSAPLKVKKPPLNHPIGIHKMRKIPRRWATEVKTRVLKTILRQLHLRQKALEFLTKTEDN